MSPTDHPRIATTLGHRFAVVLTTLAVLLLGLPLLAGPATAAPGQRIELRVLVLDGGGSSERAIAAQLAREGVPTTRVDLTSAGRQQITPAFLADAASSTAHFQGVVLPSTAPAQLGGDELAALATYERTYGVREVAANVYPGTEVSPAFTGGVGTTLDGGSVTPTAAARAAGFGQLNGTSFRVDDFSPTTAEAFGTLGAPPVLSPGEAFTPFLTATVGASSGWLAGVYSRDGREQLLVSAAYNENQQWFGQFGHGVVSWLTRGIALGHQRAYFAVHVDDVFLPDSRWSVSGNCTPGDDCVDPDTTTGDIRMTPADVDRLVAWQNANDFRLDMVYNGGGSDAAATAAGGTDPLTTAFLAQQGQFPWINHTSTHPYLGCIQIAPTVAGQTWRCATSPTDEPRQDRDVPAQASGGFLWASQAFVTSQIADNAAWGRARGLTDFDPTELVTGEHSGLATAPQQPTDNPFLAPALTSAGIAVTASDNSREGSSRTIGSAVTMPRYPMNVYYNAGTYQDQIDEYNWYYTTRANGGGGICEANPQTSTCITPLPAADQAESRASFDSYLAPLEIRNALSRVLANDPRPFYAHQSNLAEDGLLYPVVSGVLIQYRATHAASAPLVRTDMTAQARQLARSTAWATASSGAVGWVDASGVHVPAVPGVAVPVTVPASATGAGLSSWGGEQSAWTTSASTIGLSTPLGGYGGSAAPVAPSAPAVGTPTAGEGSVQVSWTAPTDLGGSAIRSYTVTAYAGDTTTVVGTATAPGSATSAAVSGLTNGVPVTVTVSATNGVGTGPASVRSVAVTPRAAAAVPAPPQSIDARPTVGGVTVSWVPPATDSVPPITGYRVDAVSSTGTTSVTTTGATPTNAVVTGLTAGTAYRVTVSTLNAAGASAPSPGLTVTPVAPGADAGAPTGVTAVAGDGQATVSWTAPAYTGTSPISQYVVVWYDSAGANVGEAYPGLVTTTTVTGLTNGKAVRFVVIPVNVDRSPLWSVVSNAVTPRAGLAAAPGAPGLADLTVASGQAQVGWTAPATDGGSPVTGYTVTVYAGSTPTVLTTATAGATDRTTTVTGLVDGTSYSVAVTATNAVGTGASSPRSATFTPVGVPGAPVLTTATPGDSSVTLGWTAPASTGGSPVSAYDVRVFAGSTLVSTTRVSGSAAGATVGGLTPGTAYTADVAAVNAAGTGAASARSAAVVPLRLVVPATPAAPTVTAAPSSITVTWSPPAANGGPAVTGYTVAVYRGTTGTLVSSTPVDGGGTSVVVGGLVNGTAYTVTVAAINSVGTGPASARSAQVTPAPRAPGAPSVTGVTAGIQALTVTWAPPVDNGGAAVTGYTVTVFSGTSTTIVRTATAGATATSLQITSLQQGTPYSVTVTARNAAGTGAASARSATVTPVSIFAPPSAPTITSVTPGARRLTVAWTPPVTTGLFGTSGYTITVYSGTGTTVATTASAGSTARSATVTGLTAGRPYTVTVTPRSLLGAGTASARSAAVTVL